MGELVIRLVFSLGVVLGLLLLCVKFAGRRFQGKGDALVKVVHRQALSRSASVSVVNVAGRVLVLGTTEHQVRLLTELDEDLVNEFEADLDFGRHLDNELDRDLDEDVDDDSEPVEDLHDLAPALTLVNSAHPRRHAGGRRAAPRKGGTRAAQKGTPLAGSMLSPATWRQAWGAVSGRAS